MPHTPITQREPEQLRGRRWIGPQNRGHGRKFLCRSAQTAFRRLRAQAHPVSHRGGRAASRDELKVLKPKPGALPGATALVQGRGSGVFTSLHQACRDAARAAKGDACGTRWLIEVLLAHRTHLAAELVVAMDWACHAHSAARPA